MHLIMVQRSFLHTTKHKPQSPPTPEYTPMNDIDDICTVILTNAALSKNLKNPKIATQVISNLLRRKGHHLASALKIKGEELISYKAHHSSEPREKDHSIPIKTITDEILKHNNIHKGYAPECKAALRVILQDHIRVVTITKSEHAYLASMKCGKLKSSMPTGWKFGDNWLARYEAANIIVCRKLPDGNIVSY